MGQLTWQNIDTNFGGGGGSQNRVNLLAENLDPLSEELARYQTQLEEKRSAREIGKSLLYTDPESHQRALEQGLLKPDKYNIEHFRARPSDLLAQQLAKMMQTKTQAEIEGQGLANQNTGITIEQNQTNLDQDRTDYSQAQAKIALNDDVAMSMANIQGMVEAGKLKEALALFDSPANRKLFADNGLSQETQDNMRTGLATFATSSRTQDTEVKQKVQTDALNDVKFPEAILNAQRDALIAAGSDAATLADQALTERTRPAKAAVSIADEEEKARKKAIEVEADAGGDALVNKHLNGGDYADIQALIQGDKEGSPAAKANALGKLEAALKAITPIGSADDLISAQELDTTGFVPDRPRVKDTYTLERPEGAPEAASIINFMDRFEGKGDYDTLYNDMQGPGRAFDGIKVSQTSVADLDKFANQGYGQSVANINGGVTATPFGRYSVVNSTLQQAIKEMGLDPKTTIFNKQTQDAVFKHLLDKRLSSASSMPAKIQALRQEWAGFKRENVSDEALGQAIREYESGNGSGLESLVNGGSAPITQEFSPTGQRAIDESYGADAERAMAEFALKVADSPTGLNWKENRVVQTNVVTSDDLSQKVQRELDQESTFGGQSPAIQAALTDKNTENLVAGDVVGEIKKLFPEMNEGNITTDIQHLIDRYGLNAKAAATLLKSSVAESWWIWSDFGGFQDQRHIDFDKVDAYMSRFMNVNATNPNEKRAGLMAALEKDRAKTTASSNLATAMSRTRETFDSYVQLAKRKQKDPSVNVERAYLKLQQALKREGALRESIKADPLLNINKRRGNPGATDDPAANAAQAAIDEAMAASAGGGGAGGAPVATLPVVDPNGPEAWKIALGVATAAR